MVSFWEIVERAGAGPRMDEKDFSMNIFKTATALAEEYDIQYDPEKPVPTDNTLIDSVWEAGLRFYVDVGAYCVSTGRVIRFTEDEIREMLDKAPSQTVLGEGKDSVTQVARKIEDPTRPVVCAGIQTAIFSDERMSYKIYKLCAQERSADGIWGGLEARVHDKYGVRAKHPTEIYQYRRNVKLLRQAVADAGRPGMFVMNNAPTSDATIAMFSREDGLRPTDPIPVGLLSEMKISYDEMKRTAFALAYGSPRGSSHSAVIGGFSGGPNTAAIVAVGGGLMALTAGYGQYVRPGTVHMRIRSRACLPCIWTAALACEAFARNSHVASDNGDHPAAGPGTKQYFYELAAYQIAVVTAGGHSKGGTRKFNIGRTENFGTPIESKWQGEVCKASAGIKREHANEIVRELHSRYKDRLMDAPEGYTFEQLYDLKKDEPKKEYLKMYEEVKAEFEEMGLNFE